MVPHKARPSKPIPRSLTALAEIASALATADSVSAVIGRALTHLPPELVDIDEFVEINERPTEFRQAAFH